VPDVAVLTLPADSAAMQDLAGAGALKPIGFVAPALDANYAFAWKRIGSVGGSLYGLPFKTTERSAFWYDARRFRNVGVKAPKTWQDLERVAGRLLRAGVKPFAIPGADGRALGDIFESIYLAQQGQARYERLAKHEIEWTDPSVKAALRAMRSVIVNPFLVAGGVRGALETDFQGAAMQVFGTKPRAAMVFGGSAVLPVVRSAKAVRPMSQFGVFAFPTIGKPPARVIGRTDAVAMVKDTPAARALVRYLATPDAAAIWAKRGGFLSPNRKLDLETYPAEASRTLAAALTSASAFRLDLSEQQPAAFRVELGELLQEYLRHPSRVDRVLAALEAAAAGPAKR
jgi:ABC-type glycerol-3-phosphate transport system substrate-binding protein